MSSNTATRSPDTRDRLLQAAVRVFAELGFEAASTRQLASQAGVNLAAIPYHFESKKGLYLAVAEYVADQIGSHLAPAIGNTDPGRLSGLSPGQSRQLLRELQHRMTALIVGDPRADAWSGFILREQAQPTEAFDILYERTMGKVLAVVTQLLAQLTGADAEDSQVQLRSFAFIGQILIFRTSRAGVLRTLGWDHYNDERIGLLTAIIDQHTDLLIEGLRAEHA